VVPVMMGLAVEFLGIEVAFCLVGAVLLLMLLTLELRFPRI